jgi:hypothetical protein
VGLCRRKEFRDVASVFVDKFDAMHSVLYHNDQEEFDCKKPKRKKFAKVSCLEARVCLCGERGSAAFSLGSFVMDSITRNFPSAALRAPVDDGDVVIRLRGYPTSDEPPEDGSVVVDEFVYLR